MNGEKKTPKDENVKGLIVFSEQKPHKSIEKEATTYEQVDQDNKIKLIHELKPFGSNYRYTLLVANQSDAPISEAKIKVRFPEFVDIIRCLPVEHDLKVIEMEDGQKQVRINLDKISKNSHQQFSFFFTPLDLEAQGEVRSYLTFVNNQDYVRAVDSKPILLMFTPITIERKILPTSQIKKFNETQGIKKAIKSIGIATDKKFDPNLFFRLIKEILEHQNYQLITNNEKSRIAWYFGMDLVSGNDVLVVAQVIKNKVEWISVSKNAHINVSVLTNLLNEFVVLLIFREIIEIPNQVFSLECVKCGVNLPFFPNKGESIKCKNCKQTQLVW